MNRPILSVVNGFEKKKLNMRLKTSYKIFITNLSNKNLNIHSKSCSNFS